MDEALAKISSVYRRIRTRLVWFEEVLSFIVALLALVAIVMVLAIHQGRPLPQWPSMISINSLVSIFTAILKASMLLPIAEGISELKWIWFSASRPMGDMDGFDLASRGPWGSFLLIFRTLRQSPLASLGALLTVLALAIDPFSQQVIQYYNCLEPSTDFHATIVRTNTYLHAGPHVGAGQNSLDSSMAAALYLGLIDPPANASASIPFDCRSGNCTFDDMTYSSLAMCASVSDISHLVSDNISEISSTVHNYSLPSGLYSSAGSAVYFQCTEVSSFRDNMEDSPLFEFESIMLNADCNGEEFSSTSDCALRPWAFRASLTPCVHTYGRASIKNQILEEEILNTTYLQWVNMSHGYSLYYSLAGDLPSIQGIDCSSSAIPSGKKTQATSLFQSGMRYINNSDPAINDKDILWYDPACTYEFGFIPAQAIVDYLRMFFGTRHYNVMALSAPYGHPNNTEGYIWHQRLYANGTANLTSTRAYMESLANKMSAIIRQRGDDSPITPLQGEVQVVQTCIHVQWWWLALPIALLLLAILFFVTTIVISQRPLTSVAGRAERRPWKSSCLPLLWCGLDDQTRRRYGPLNNLTEMEDCADDLKVTLIRKHDPMDGGRWTLSEQQYRKRVTTI